MTEVIDSRIRFVGFLLKPLLARYEDRAFVRRPIQFSIAEVFGVSLAGSGFYPDSTRCQTPFFALSGLGPEDLEGRFPVWGRDFSEAAPAIQTSGRSRTVDAARRSTPPLDSQAPQAIPRSSEIAERDRARMS